MTAIAAPILPRDKDVSWLSNDPDIASLKPGNGNKGRFVGVGLGAASISANLNTGVTDITVNGVLDVVNVEVHRLSISPSRISLPSGGSLALSCNVETVSAGVISAPVAVNNEAVWATDKVDVLSLGVVNIISRAINLLQVGSGSVCCYYQGERACSDIRVE